MLKKRQSRRMSSRKIHNIEKKNKMRSKKLSKLKKKETVKLPKSVLLTDEDLEELKRIKEEERVRATKKEEIEKEDTPTISFGFKKLVEENDLLLEVVDARDPLGSINPLNEKYVVEKGKELVLFLNNKGSVPLEKVNQWEEYLKEKGYKIIEGGMEGMEDRSILKNKRIGIFGQRGVGKMYILKHLLEHNTVEHNTVEHNTVEHNTVEHNTVEHTFISKDLYRTLPHSYDLLSLLRNVIPLKSVFYKKLLNDYLSLVDRDNFSLYFGIPYFHSLRDLEESFIKKYKLSPSGIDLKIFKIILRETHQGNINFYREDVEGKIVFTFN